MKEKLSKPAPVSDMEVLEKAMYYFATLRPVLLSNRLNDVCSGILVLVHELILFLDKNGLTDYGNNKK